MPTLDRRLLAWSDDSDTEDGGQTPTSWNLDDDGSYDQCGGATTFVDDVLVPAGANGRAGRTLLPADDDGARDSGGVCARPPSSGTRKACAAAGLVAVGCLCGYLAWRCGTGRPLVSS